MNVGAALCQSSIKTQLWSIPMWCENKGMICSSHDWKGKAEQEVGN